MKKTYIFAGTVLAGLMAACQSPDNITVAEYCADPDKAFDNVCQLNVEVNGTKTALADTDVRLKDARSMADSAMFAAKGAQTRADEAMHMAEDAMSMAHSAQTAANTIDNLHCETNTINQTDTGSCPANFRLMSCTQTRYTHRAGGLSILREIDDKSCRFNTRVLEMKVRCCTVASNRRQITYSRPVSTSTVQPTATPVASTRSGVQYTPLSSGS